MMNSPARRKRNIWTLNQPRQEASRTIANWVGGVLTFRKGTGGAPTAASAMAEHLREQTLPEFDGRDG